MVHNNNDFMILSTKAFDRIVKYRKLETFQDGEVAFAYLDRLRLVKEYEVK